MRARLPSGTVTFVLSDIEGSTRRRQEDEAAMRDALARHDEIIRASMEAHGGHVVKHTGDGLMAPHELGPDDHVHTCRHSDSNPMRCSHSVRAERSS